MSPWSEGEIFASDQKIHYYRTGGDKPPVVFNHGAGDDGLCWTHVAKELEADYDLILPDARGHGKSGSGQGDYSTSARVADLTALIRALKLDHPVIGGHSLGADTCLNLAAEFPDLPRAVFLEDPPIILPGEAIFGSDPDKMKNAGKMMKTFMTTFKILPHFLAVPLARRVNRGYPDDEILPWVASKKRLNRDFFNSMTLLDFITSDPLAPFQKVRVPTLLIIGDKAKMSIVSESTAAAASRCNELVRVVHLEGASHDIRRTRFDGYLPALKSFLAEVYAD